VESRVQGCRILIVEDSPIIAQDTEEMVSALGGEVVGPAPNMAVALVLAQEERIEAAVVDINIRGGKAFSVLTILEERGIPFVLTSGYADWTMPEAWQGRPRLPKPYSHTALREQLEQLLGSSPKDGED
jgi:DNA-binding NtrC family response regulator